MASFCWEVTLEKGSHDDGGSNEIGETVLDKPVGDFSQRAPEAPLPLGRIVDEKETELGRPTFDVEGNLLEQPPPTPDPIHREAGAATRRPAVDFSAPRRPKQEARAHPPSRPSHAADPKRDTLLYVGIGVLALLILVLSVAIAIGFADELD